MKNKFYRIISLVLSILVLATACICPTIASGAETAKMVHIESNHKGPFGIQIAAIAGETYTYKFSMTNGVDINVVLHDRDARYQDLNATVVLKSSVNKGSYTDYEYEVTVPATVTKNTVILGITFNGSGPWDCYFFNPTCYRTSDPEKTELLAYKFEDGYLNGWLWKYTSFGNSGNLTEKSFTEDSKTGKVSVVDYDENLIPKAKMVQINSTHKGPFAAAVKVTAGEKYTFKFSLSDTVAFNVAMHDKDSRHQNLNAAATLKSSVDKGGYTMYEYEVVAPASYTKDVAMLGLTFDNSAAYQAYFFDASCYKTSDTTKAELFANGSFVNGYLNAWSWKYTNFGSAGNLTEKTFVEDSLETTVKVIEFDETLMPSPKMVQINSTHEGPFAAAVKVTAGEKYTFKFSLSDTVAFNVVMHDKDSRHTNLNAAATLKNSEDKGGYTVYEYEVVVPASYTKDVAMLGLTFDNSTAYQAYFFDASCYKTSDTSKTELFANGTFISGYLNSWTWKYTNFGSAGNLTEKTFTEDSLETTVKVIEFNESLMPTDYSKKMLKINSAAHKGVFGTQITAVAGESYTFKFGISNTVDFDVVMFDKDSRHQNLGASANLKSSENKGGYTLYEYEVVVPASVTKTTVVIGLLFNETSTFECYFFDASCYRTLDTNKFELISNGNFAEGYLNGWLWKYTTFGSTANLTEKTFAEDNKEITVKVLEFDETLMPDNSTKMLKINSAGHKGVFGTQIDGVAAGEAYTFKFGLSNNVKFNVVMFDKDARYQNLNATATLKNSDDKGGYTLYEYEVVVPATVQKTTVIIGLLFDETTNFECYFFDASCYKTSDVSKTELLKNGTFKDGFLNSWLWKYTTFGNTTNLTEKTFTEDNKEITVKVVYFDEALMPDNSPKMLHFVSQSFGPFGQHINVKDGETYVFNFKMSNNIKFDVVVNDNDQRHVPTAGVTVKQISAEDKGRYAEYSFEVTMPETVLSTKTGLSTDIVVLGIKLKGVAPFDGYFADASVYKKSDASKTEMLENGDFASGFLDKWVFKYTGFLSGDNLGLKFATFKDDAKSVTLEVVKFDEEKMQNVPLEAPDDKPKMLYFKTNNKGPINQRVTVVPGATYTITFSISNNVENISVGIFDNDKRHMQLEAKSKFVAGEDKGRYSVLTYEITMPNVIKDQNGNDTTTVFLGVLFGGTLPVEGYFFDAILYKNGDETKTNMFKNGDFFSGYLDYWAWRWNADFSSESKHGATKGTFKHSDGDVYLEVVRRDESVMEDVSAVLPDPSRKMIYFKNGAVTQPFSAWVDCEPGKKFIVKYSIYATDEVVPHFNANGLRGNLNGNLEKLSEVKTGKHTTYTYRMTVPQSYSSDKLIFLGFRMPFYAEGYLFDIECYAEGEKESAWDNGDFMFGFNDWIWGWTVTWFSKAGNQLKEWSDGMNEIRLVPYDLSLIDALDNEINRDDGEWWKPSDIVEKEEYKGVATVTGTFKDQNGTAIPNVTMILKSLKKTYTSVADENGAFSFKNIVADFYELYYVNAEGEEVLTDFAYALANGDTAKLSVVTDTTELTKVEVSGLKGTVYTPELKVVSNLKVYLRGFGDVKTDKDGNFAFKEVPVGKYELYTVLEDGSEYVFREVEVKENIELAVKLKYAPETETQTDEEAEESFNWIWIIVICGAVVILAAGLTVFVVLKKKSKK